MSRNAQGREATELKKDLSVEARGALNGPPLPGIPVSLFRLGYNYSLLKWVQKDCGCQVVRVHPSSLRFALDATRDNEADPACRQRWVARAQVSCGPFTIRKAGSLRNSHVGQLPYTCDKSFRVGLMWRVYRPRVDPFSSVGSLRIIMCL